jgi:hypothetical protein
VTESHDLGPSRAKRLIVALVVLALIISAVVFVVMLVSSKAPSPVCDHVAEIAKTNPREADNFVDAIVTHLSSQLVQTNLRTGKSKTISTVEGDSTDERCRSAMRILDEGLPDAERNKLVDCLTHVATVRDARSKCLGGN